MSSAYSRKAVKLFFISAIIVFYNAVSFSADTATDIILYGNEKCGYCRETIQWLEDKKIPYVYRDVESYGTFQEEMFDKLKRSGFTTTAIFPVLDIKGQILMKPAFNDITKALAGQKIGSQGERKKRKTLWRPQKNKSLKTDFNSVKNYLKDTDVIIYDDGSGSGNMLLKHLKKEKITYTLKQLNKMNNAAYFDMCARLAALGYDNVTLFPVVEVRGEIIMNPSIEDVKILIIEMITP